MRVGLFTEPMLLQSDSIGADQVRALLAAFAAMRPSSLYGAVTVELFDPWRESLDDYDLIHVIGSANGNHLVVEAAAACGVPVVLSVGTETDACAHPGMFGRAANFLRGALVGPAAGAETVKHRAALAAATLVVTHSRAQRHLLAEQCQLDFTRLRVVPPGIDAAWFQADPGLCRQRGAIRGEFALVTAPIGPGPELAELALALADMMLPLVVCADPHSAHPARLRQLRTIPGVILPGSLRHEPRLLASVYAAASVFIAPTGALAGASAGASTRAGVSAGAKAGAGAGAGAKADAGTGAGAGTNCTTSAVANANSAARATPAAKATAAANATSAANAAFVAKPASASAASGTTLPGTAPTAHSSATTGAHSSASAAAWANPLATTSTSAIAQAQLTGHETIGNTAVPPGSRAPLPRQFDAPGSWPAATGHALAALAAGTAVIADSRDHTELAALPDSEYAVKQVRLHRRRDVQAAVLRLLEAPPVRERVRALVRDQTWHLIAGRLLHCYADAIALHGPVPNVFVGSSAMRKPFAHSPRQA